MRIGNCMTRAFWVVRLAEKETTRAARCFLGYSEDVEGTRRCHLGRVDDHVYGFKNSGKLHAFGTIREGTSPPGLACGWIAPSCCTKTNIHHR